MADVYDGGLGRGGLGKGCRCSGGKIRRKKTGATAGCCEAFLFIYLTKLISIQVKKV